MAFEGFHTLSNLPTGDGREDLIVCPKEHTIRMLEDTVFVHANDRTVVMECDGKVFAQAQFNALTNSVIEMETWQLISIKDHTIEYLRNLIKEMKDG